MILFLLGTFFGAVIAVVVIAVLTISGDGDGY